MSRLSRAAEFLGLRRSIVGLLGLVLLVGLGEQLGDRFLPMYLMVVLGGGELAVGLFSGLKNLLGALYSYPGGYLPHRYGAQRALLIFNLLAMFGYALVILIPAWPAAILGAAFFLSWSAISMPATMGLIADVLPSSKRTMGVSLNSLVRRMPKALGPLIGGAFIGTFGLALGVRLAFAVAFVMAGLGILVQRALIIGPAPDRTESTAPAHPLRLFAEMSPPLRRLLVSDILIRFCEQIPEAFVVIWCMKTVAAPVTAEQFGIMSAIEMVTAVLAYVPVAYFADRGGKQPFVLATFVFFSLFPLALMFCQSFWPLVAAFVLRGLKEFGEPTRKALIVDLCPADRKELMFGLYYLLRDTVVSLAAFGGAALWAISPQLNLLTAFAMGVVGTLWFALSSRRR